MDQPNDQLRQARQRMPSRQAQGESLSRRELAELVNAWVYGQTGKVVELDANYIGKLERGKIRWPSKVYREAFRAILQLEAASQLGFYGQRKRSAIVNDVDRQHFLRTAGAFMTLPWQELYSPITSTPVPNKVTPVEIDQLRTAATFFTAWDNAKGSGLAREAIFMQLRWASRLLHADCETGLRAELFAAVAQLGAVAGFMAFDACAHDDARGALRFSLACAEESGDWHVRARVLSTMARQAVWCDQADDALTQVEMALVRGDRLSATEKAALHTLRARALARLHRTGDCLSAVGAADESFAHSKPADDPSWMVYYNHAQHYGDTGQALFALEVQGRRTQAAQRLAYSVARYSRSYVRSRALARTSLASLHMMTGDPREAAVIGHAALASAGSLRSKRATEDLWELHRFAGCHPNISEAAELRGCIAETLAGR